MNFNHILSYLHTDPLMQRVWNPGHKYTWRILLYFHNVHLYSDGHTDIHLYLWIERKCNEINWGIITFGLSLGIYSNYIMNVVIIPEEFISTGFQHFMQVPL